MYFADVGECYTSAIKQQELIEKIKRLPQDRIAEVEEFVDLLSRDPGLERKALHQGCDGFW